MRLLTPGPASSLPQVLAAMATDPIHHRTEEFRQLYRACVEGLKDIFGITNGEVAILSGSGTTGLEAGILNAFEAGDRVLVIDSGYFGDRLAAMARLHQLEVIHYRTDWKDTYDLEDVKKYLAQYPDLKGILMVYSETSTGALHDIRAIGELTADTPVLLMVDCISGIVMNPFAMEEWKIDIAVAASQKGFFLPPGLALVGLSDRAMKRARSVARRSYYLNLPLIIDKYHDDQKIGATPSIALLQGLRKALEVLHTQPMHEWNHYYADLHSMMQSRLRELGLPPFCHGKQSNSLYACQVPPGKAFAIRDALYDNTKILIEVGLGACSEQMLRIGCMNAITVFDVLDLCRGLEAICMEKEK